MKYTPKEYLAKLNDITCSNTDNDLKYHEAAEFLKEPVFDLYFLHQVLNLIKAKTDNGDLNKETITHYSKLRLMIKIAMDYHRSCSDFELLLMGEENEE